MSRAVFLLCNMGRLGRTLLAAWRHDLSLAPFNPLSNFMPDATTTIPAIPSGQIASSTPETAISSDRRDFAHRWAVSVLVERVISQQQDANHV